MRFTWYPKKIIFQKSFFTVNIDNKASISDTESKASALSGDISGLKIKYSEVLTDNLCLDWSAVKSTIYYYLVDNFSTLATSSF